MKLLLTFFAIFALNAWYLFSFRRLMVKLEHKATAYWERIGRPNSFSANHVASILSKLYTKEMAEVAKNASIWTSVKTVRVLLPVTFVLSLYYRD